MGLDAHVFCNCLREGTLKTEPPVALERIFIDPVEGILEIDYPKGMDQKAQDDLWFAVNRWSRHSCEHEGMYYCDVRVGNWASVRILQEALAERGEFPVLSAIFPSGNGGIVEVETARKALAELDAFCGQLGSQQGIFLIDGGTGNTLYSHVSCYDGIFSMDGKLGVDLGFDEAGIFVQKRQTKEILFRSLHCRQILLPQEERTGMNGKVYMVSPALLVDLNSGREFKVSSKIGWQNSPGELKVIRRNLRKEDFYSIGPLREVLAAADVTGNPVFWT